MTIKFVRDHEVEGPPRETFKKGQVVEGRSDASELHFVRRGHAVFVDKKSGELFDHDGKPVNDPAADKAAADKSAADKSAADKAAK